MTEQLEPGDRGEAVAELQERLAALDIPVTVTGTFDAPTADAVRAFQRSRGLRESGHVERETWTALLEAGFGLGDRLLYQRRPMLRGEDVVDLQHRLNGLGFDAGREDGIFGPRTETAVREFQRNAGLATDGVFGPATRAALVRLGALADGSVARVRERERMRDRTLAGARVFLAAEPGLDVIGGAVVHCLGPTGAITLLDRTGADDHELASAANDWEADIALALRVAAEPGARCYFFANQAFRSEGGYAIACALNDALDAVLGPAPPPAGRTFTLLRETRMATVICEPVQRGDAAAMGDLVARAHDVGDAVVTALRRTLGHGD